MPKYKLTSPSGQTITISGEKPPSQDDAAKIFAHVQDQGTSPSPSPIETGTKAPSKDWIDTASDWLPAAGGLAGGVLGAGLMSIPLAALGGAGGKGFQLALHALRHGIDSSKTGTQEALGNAGEMLGEGATQGAYEAGGMAAGKVLGVGARAAYRKVLRPSLSERLAPRAAETVETGIQEGINPFSLKSLKKIEPQIQDLNSQAEGIIKGGVQPGAGSVPGASGPYFPLINPKDIAVRVQKTIDKFAGAGADPADRAAARGVRKSFLKDVSRDTIQQVPTGALDNAGNPIMQAVRKRVIQPMSGEELLAGRRATGKSAGATSFGITRGAETEARKELYHEMGTELGTHFPEVKPIFNQERKLIDLKDAAFKAHEREANGPIVSLRRLLPYGGGMLTYQLDKDPKTAITNAIAIELATNPRLAARAALMAAMAARHPHVIANMGRGIGTGIGALLEDSQ